MRQEMIFNVGHNNYVVGKHYFQKNKKENKENKKQLILIK